MVSLQHDFVCVLLDAGYFDNICRIPCTCICRCEYSYDNLVQHEMKNVSHIHHINTVCLLNDFVCVPLDPVYFYNICRILCTCIYLCGYSYDNLVQREMKNVSHIHHINTVCLLNDFVCVLLDAGYFDNICRILCTCICRCEYSYDNISQCEMKNVSHIHHMSRVSLLNDFACVPLDAGYFHNICRILCTCIYLCGYFYDDTMQSEMKNVSHTDRKNTTYLQRATFCEFS